MSDACKQNHESKTLDPKTQQSDVGRDGWKEAAIAWTVCASIYEQYAKGKDPLFKTKHADYVRHAEDARAKLK